MFAAIAIIAGLAAFAAGLYLLVRRGRSGGAVTGVDVAARIQTVDLEAFQNLLDAEDSNFLRRRLPPSSFRRVQRLRLRAAIGYYRRIAGNAAVFLRLGESCAASPEPAIAIAGRQLSETAITVRVTALRSIALLAITYPWPTAVEIPSAIADQYAQLRALAATLGRLQHVRPEVVAAS
jgi:hypothetical protein